MRTRHWTGIAGIALILIGLLFTTIGTRQCGPVPSGISTDSAQTLVRHGDTLRSDDTLFRHPAAHDTVCVNGGTVNWPYLVLGLLALAVVATWLWHDLRAPRTPVMATSSMWMYRCTNPSCGMRGQAVARSICASCGLTNERFQT